MLEPLYDLHFAPPHTHTFTPHTPTPPHPTPTSAVDGPIDLKLLQIWVKKMNAIAVNGGKANNGNMYNKLYVYIYNKWGFYRIISKLYLW